MAGRYKKRPKIWYDYLYFLLKKIDFNKKEWYKLLEMLHDMPFEWSSEVPMDRNRALDGEFQRDEFFSKMGIRHGEFDYPCSIVEMLVAFTLRIGDEFVNTIGYDGYEKYDIIFLSFLENLDINFDDNYEDLIEKIGFWIKREYKNDGIGSIFPLKKSKIGYKNMEIWVQMFEFLSQWRIKNVEDFGKFR